MIYCIMKLKKLSYSFYDKTETLNINDKSIDVVEGLIIPLLTGGSKGKIKSHTSFVCLNCGKEFKK